MPLHKYHMTLLVWFPVLPVSSLKSLLQRGNQTMKMTSRQRVDVITLITFAPKPANFMYKYGRRYVHCFEIRRINHFM